MPATAELGRLLEQLASGVDSRGGRTRCGCSLGTHVRADDLVDGHDGLVGLREQRDRPVELLGRFETALDDLPSQGHRARRNEHAQDDERRPHDAVASHLVDLGLRPVVGHRVLSAGGRAGDVRARPARSLVQHRDARGKDAPARVRRTKFCDEFFAAVARVGTHVAYPIFELVATRLLLPPSEAGPARSRY